MIDNVIIKIRFISDVVDFGGAKFWTMMIDLLRVWGSIRRAPARTPQLQDETKRNKLCVKFKLQDLAGEVDIMEGLQCEWVRETDSGITCGGRIPIS